MKISLKICPQKMDGIVFVKNAAERRGDIVPANVAEQYCRKCKKTMGSSNFYMSNNLEKYPNHGLLNECKKCLTMHVDNWDPDTFLWILEEVDVPYMEDMWNNLLERYATVPEKVTGTTIVGRYLAKIRLKKWKDYRFKDSEMLKAQIQEEKKAILMNSGLSEEDIDKEINKSFIEKPEGVMTDSERITAQIAGKGAKDKEKNKLTESADGVLTIDLSGEEAEREAKLDSQLTPEDKEYLLTKWGRYKPSEWIKLENLYNDMCASFDIQTASHKDNLVLMCKASLKTHQLLDLGDIEGAQKASRMYDTLLKSGNFSALQNKEEVGDAVDSIGALVAICEKEGFIPRFYQGNPNDKVDETIEDQKRYARSLVTEELNLGNLIEKAIKDLKEEKERENITTEELDKSIHQELTEKDYLDSEEFIDKMLEKDLEMYKDGSE